MNEQGSPDKVAVDESPQALLSRWAAGRVVVEVMSDPRRFWIFFLVGFLSLVVVAELFRGLRHNPHADVQLYQKVALNTLDGRLPYRDYVLEYPPYAVPFFLVTALRSSERGHLAAFSAQMLLVDWLVKGLLLWMVFRWWREQGAAAPPDEGPAAAVYAPPARMFLPLVVFCLCTAPNHYFYLQRYDLIPAALCLGVLLAWWRQRHGLAGVLLMVAIGAKLYPVVWVPPLLVLAWRTGRLRPFVLGLAAGAAPLVLMGLVAPWWRFLDFHAERGLQVESLFASVIWLGKHLGLWAAEYKWIKSWLEVKGPMAERLFPLAWAVFVLATVAGVAAACWRLYRAKEGLSLPELARVLLLPLLAFVAFNIILSPQYMIWLSVVVAVAALGQWTRPLLWITVAAFITPIIFPGYHYSTGESLVEALVLVIRNGLLVLAAVKLFRQMRSTP
ncbi:glycosyltransferase family 87 protein [Fontisphaera persica]|uniref:glycosyltransferase family 87 protein n=1 Tax=Fontisphaera persica TaxID=2974023 RepID=UPI0024C072B3|nr:glycosyltransferase family 87 protein [Fontisphaera persica]WCJ61134.1 glycosyltransferase family 87 protein [Fontisphaera persica]